MLVLPWNLIDEIAAQLDYVADWGGQLIVPVPDSVDNRTVHRAVCYPGAV